MSVQETTVEMIVVMTVIEMDVAKILISIKNSSSLTHHLLARPPLVHPLLIVAVVIVVDLKGRIEERGVVLVTIILVLEVLKVETRRLLKKK